MKIKQERKKAYEKVKLNIGKRAWKDKKKTNQKKGEKKVKSIILLLGIFLMVSMLSACAPKVVPVEKATAPEETQITVKEAWEIEWGKTLAEAKKEGYLIVSNARAKELRDLIGNAFKDKYGVDIKWLAGRSAETATKITAERRAGLYTIDIGVEGGNTSIRHKRSGFLESLPPIFILPEVKDSSAWLGGKYPFIDSEYVYVFSLTLYPQEPIFYNTDLVSPEEFTSYQKLLDPKWRKKFIAKDTTTTGSGHKWFSVMIEEDFGPILGLDYMKALVKQEPLIFRDDRLAGEWLLRGKYPFGLNISFDDMLTEWKRQGIRVPLEQFTPKEGGYLTTGGQNLTFFKNAPHPNAARVFINWVLSREGAITMTRTFIKHTTRIDIGDPREFEPGVRIRQPGIKYVNADLEKYLLKTDEYAQKAIEIFGTLMK